MARSYSKEFKSTLAKVSAEEAPIIMLEITHPQLTQPIRVVNDTVDVVSNGNTFIAFAFTVSFPDDMEGSLPKARLSVDNVGRDMMYWIETTAGGNGSKVRFMQIMRSRPNQIEWDITMSLTNVVANPKTISADLSFENLFARQAINFQFRPENSPGVF